MGSECRAEILHLQSANVYIRLCGDVAEVGITPPWDNIERHEYIAIGKVDKVINDLRQLAKELLSVANELEKMVKGSG